MTRAAAIVLILLTTGMAAAAGQPVAVAVTSLHDAFVRELDPMSNYGAGGALCVAGVASVNGAAQPRGRFDAVLKFDVAAALADFDADFGAGHWVLSSVDLQVAQVGAPANTLFPRGDGNFEVAWLSEDAWAEGIGSPGSPQTPSGSELTWLSLQSLLNTATRRSLGVFSATQLTQVNQYSLALDPDFVADMLATGLVSLHVAPQSTTLGFTFHSRNFGDPTSRPQLILIAAPFLRGDMNCDDVLDNSDVDLFVLSLADPTSYHLAYPECDILRADLNADGVIDGRDVTLFIAALLSP